MASTEVDEDVMVQWRHCPGDSVLPRVPLDREEAAIMWGLLVRAVIAALRGATTNGVRVAAFGRIVFIGLIGNRPLAQLGQQEIRNAFAKIGLREAHNSHFISRLIERGPQFGINTLNDLARALNMGVARAGSQAGTVEMVFPGGRAAAVVNSVGELVTFLPL